MLYRLKLYLRSLFLCPSMYMKLHRAYLWGLLTLLAACGGETDHRGRTPLVEVDGAVLYKEDVKASMPMGLSKADSALFMENYIRKWVEDVLLYEKAENNISDKERIEALVQSYRKSLIMHDYQQHLVDQVLTNELSDEEMKQFYENNKPLFRVDETLVKGLYIKVPQTSPGINRIRRWYKSKDEESVDRLEKYSLSNAVDYIYFYDRWMPASVLLARLPYKFKNAEYYLSRNRHIELKDSAYYYFLHVDDILKRGQEKPFDAARDEVKKTLGNLKQTEFMRQVRADLYQTATEKKRIKYYYKDQ